MLIWSKVYKPFRIGKKLVPLQRKRVKRMLLIIRQKYSFDERFLLSSDINHVHARC